MIDRMDRSGDPQHVDRSPSVVMTTETLGPRVSPRDLIGHLIRNPDEVMEADNDAYDRIMTNPIVSAEFTDLISPIVDADLVVEGYGDETNRVLTEIMNELPGIHQFKEQMLIAYIQGIRITEMIWGVREIDGRSYNVPVEFKPHDPGRFAKDLDGRWWMTQDSFIGRNTRNNNIVITHEGKAIFIPFGQISVHTYRDGDGRYGYGKGEGKNLYRLVKAWDAAFEFWLDYNQSFGTPVKVMKLDPDYVREQLANDKTVADIVADELQRLEDLIGNDAYVHDKRNELFYMSASDTPVGTFEKLLRYIGELIKLQITGEILTTGEGKGGSFALANLSKDRPIGRRARLSKGLSQTIQSDVVEAIVIFNGAAFNQKRGRGKTRIKVPKVTPREKIEFMKESPFPVLEDEWYDMTETTKPTAEQINRGEALTPAEVGNGGGSLFG